MAKKSDKLFQYFEGNFVQILLDRDIESTEQSDDTVSMIKTPLMINGFLVDQDDDFYYLTQDVSNPIAILISGAVRKGFIMNINIAELEDIQVEMPNVDTPSDPKKWN